MALKHEKFMIHQGIWGSCTPLFKQTHMNRWWWPCECCFLFWDSLWCKQLGFLCALRPKGGSLPTLANSSVRLEKSGLHLLSQKKYNSGSWNCGSNLNSYHMRKTRPTHRTWGLLFSMRSCSKMTKAFFPKNLNVWPKILLNSVLIWICRKTIGKLYTPKHSWFWYVSMARK